MPNFATLGADRREHYFRHFFALYQSRGAYFAHPWTEFMHKNRWRIVPKDNAALCYFSCAFSACLRALKQSPHKDFP